MAFNNKASANKDIIPPSCVLLTPFPKTLFKSDKRTSFINEKAIDVISEAALSAMKAGRTPPSCFIILCFTV